MADSAELISRSTTGHMPWYCSALLSLAFFCLGAYVLGRFSQAPFVSMGLCSAGYLLFGLLFALYDWVCLSVHLGRVACLRDSSMYVSDELAPGVWIAVLGGLFLFLGQISTILGFNSDPSSIGIISILTIGTSLAGAILHYFVYGERLTCVQVFGMIGIFAGLILICLQSSSEGKISAFLYGMGAVFGYCFKNFTARVCDQRRLNVRLTNTLGSISMGAIGLISLLGFYLAGANTGIGDFTSMGMNLAGGFSMCVGVYFVTQAIMTGPVGPAAIIANSFGVPQLWLEYFFHNNEPSLQKVVGSAVMFAFTAVMLMGDSVIDYFRARTDSGETRTGNAELREPLISRD